MFKKINKVLNEIMGTEFLAKWLLTWGIAVNVIFISLVIAKIIIFIASL